MRETDRDVRLRRVVGGRVDCECPGRFGRVSHEVGDPHDNLIGRQILERREVVDLTRGDGEGEVRGPHDALKDAVDRPHEHLQRVGINVLGDDGRGHLRVDPRDVLAFVRHETLDTRRGPVDGEVQELRRLVARDVLHRDDGVVIPHITVGAGGERRRRLVRQTHGRHRGRDGGPVHIQSHGRGFDSDRVGERDGDHVLRRRRGRVRRRIKEERLGRRRVERDGQRIGGSLVADHVGRRRGDDVLALTQRHEGGGESRVGDERLDGSAVHHHGHRRAEINAATRKDNIGDVRDRVDGIEGRRSGGSLADDVELLDRALIAKDVRRLDEQDVGPVLDRSGEERRNAILDGEGQLLTVVHADHALDAGEVVCDHQADGDLRLADGGGPACRRVLAVDRNGGNHRWRDVRQARIEDDLAFKHGRVAREVGRLYDDGDGRAVLERRRRLI